MKKVLVYLSIFIFMICAATPVQAATQSIPEIDWQKCLGGTSTEFAESIQQTKDGGYIVVGNTYSNDSDVSGNHGNEDAWVVKLKENGEIDWQRCLGGTSSEHAYSIQELNDGGYIVAGYAFSYNGDVSGNYGNKDAWVVKLKENGEIDWQKNLGGRSDECVYNIHEAKDGGYIVVGNTHSNNGDVSGNHGKDDAWVIKLEENGEIDWQKCLGGTANDSARSIQQTSDGGYIVLGYTFSQDDDVSGNHGGFDAWVVKLKENGEIDWQKCLGGSATEYAYSIQQTEDGGYIVAGNSYSNDGDVSGNHGNDDAWVVKLKENGEIEWQKCLGGTSNDAAFSIQQTDDGGYIVAGRTYSQDGDVSGNQGGYDAWVVKLKENGGIEWQKCLGGPDTEYAYSIQQTNDGGYMVAGRTNSQEGDVSGNHGNYDVWIVKLVENGDEAPASNGDASMNRPRALIRERTFAGQTLATFRNDGFGLLKVIDPVTKAIDFRAPLRSEEKDVRLRISYADIQTKVAVGAKNLLIEHRDQKIKIPMSVIDCEELLFGMPSYDEAMIEIHLIEKEDGSIEKVIQLIVVEQVDEKTKLVHRVNVQ